MEKLKLLWQRLFSNEQLEKAGDVVESGAEITKASLEFAIALGVLATAPSAPVVAAGLSFVGIARSGLRLLRDKTNEKVEIAEWVAVACPLAYLSSLPSFIISSEDYGFRVTACVTETSLMAAVARVVSSRSQSNSCRSPDSTSSKPNSDHSPKSSECRDTR